MQRSEFDSSFSLYKLSELIEKFPSKRKLKEFLQTFPCSINPDLEDFLNNKPNPVEWRQQVFLSIQDFAEEFFLWWPRPQGKD